MYHIKDYDYALPDTLIAQSPAAHRDQSRLMVMDRASGTLTHARFGDVGRWFQAGDVLVVNDTRVMPGRLYGKKASGGKAEILVLAYDEPSDGASGPATARCLVKASKACRPGTRITVAPSVWFDVVSVDDGIVIAHVTSPEPMGAMLERHGRMPLPPYIHQSVDAAAEPRDRDRYQTVYAAHSGAVAAPTAGLHFTPELIAGLEAIGVCLVQITLHVGYGTFMPVRVDDIRHHRMHTEVYHVKSEAAETINRARSEGRRIIAVGTTSVRTLEFAADAGGQIKAGTDSCDLFIYPGYRFRVVDAMITNFHLPKSTLLMLISAFAGRDAVLAAYAEAVAEQYRFFSYGDAMLIL